MPDEVLGLALELATATQERDRAAVHNNELQREIAELRKAVREVDVRSQLADTQIELKEAQTSARSWQQMAAHRERERDVGAKNLSEAVTRAEQYKEQLELLRRELREAATLADDSRSVADAQRKRADESSVLAAGMRAEAQAAAQLRLALRAFLED